MGRPEYKKVSFLSCSLLFFLRWGFIEPEALLGKVDWPVSVGNLSGSPAHTPRARVLGMQPPTLDWLSSWVLGIQACA